MTYKTDIPKSQRSPRNSVSDMQGNFTQFDTTFQVNHTALNNSNEGKHEDVILTLQSAAPTVSGDVVNLYSFNATSQAGTQPQVFSKIPKFLPDGITTGTTNKAVQWTYNKVATTATTPSSTLPYQSFLFGGYIIYFNQSQTGTNSVTVTLSPAPTKILSVIAQPTTVDAITVATFAVSTRIVNNSQFQIFCFTAAKSFQWIAIAQA